MPRRRESDLFVGDDPHPQELDGPGGRQENEQGDDNQQLDEGKSPSRLARPKEVVAISDVHGERLRDD